MSTFKSRPEPGCGRAAHGTAAQEGITSHVRSHSALLQSQPPGGATSATARADSLRYLTLSVRKQRAGLALKTAALRPRYKGRPHAREGQAALAGPAYTPGPGASSPGTDRGARACGEPAARRSGPGPSRPGPPLWRVGLWRPPQGSSEVLAEMSSPFLHLPAVSTPARSTVTPMPSCLPLLHWPRYTRPSGQVKVPSPFFMSFS